MTKEFNKLCTPAKIYFMLAVLYCLIGLFNKMSVLAVFIKLVFAFIWTWMLSWLCQKGFASISWFLVLFPYIVIALSMFGILRMKH